MYTIDYLNQLTKTLCCYDCLVQLERGFGIKTSVNPEYPDLFCLNYDQIKSPKMHRIVLECRSLVITWNNDKNLFEVVSRSFDRFFNVGETALELNIQDCYCVDKIDGSLISVFYYEGKWLYRTRSMIMPEQNMTTPCGVSWKELIEQTIKIDKLPLQPENTYIFELTSPENRGVTRYDKRQAYLLGVRENATGAYTDRYKGVDYFVDNGILYPNVYLFDTQEELKGFVESLPNLQEGVVIYDNTDTPIMKLKSSVYLISHRLRGDCLNSKRIMDLIFMNEQDEYLAIFPEDRPKFDVYLIALGRLVLEFEHYWRHHRNIESQKEYALKVKELPVATLLFSKRQNLDLTFRELFDRLLPSKKYDLLEKFKK